jgi:hypothetical protein
MMIGAVFQRLADSIDEMRSEACRDGLLFGLRGVPEYLACRSEKVQQSGRRHGSRQWERLITDEIARRCNGFIKPQPKYPKEAISMFDGLPRGSRRRVGDLLVSLDSCIPLFVECKSVFECVLGKKSITDTSSRPYHYDYRAENENIFTDPSHAMTCVSIEETWIDAQKLNCLWRREVLRKYHLGLLLLEFDREERELFNRADYKAIEGKLCCDQWRKVGRKSWRDKVPCRADKGFQEHVVLWVKLAGNGF